MFKVFSWNGVLATEALLPEQARALVEQGKAVEIASNAIMMKPHQRVPEDWLRKAHERAEKLARGAD